jgi:CheY-like chemotaxis protein
MQLQRGSTHRPTVLLVDDDNGFRESLAEGLLAFGFQVHEAANGIDAFDLLEHMEVPDAVVLDLSMPGMHGWEFLEELRDDPPLSKLPVIVLTGSADARAPDADALLHKPVALADLVRVLREELDSPPEPP